VPIVTATRDYQHHDPTEGFRRRRDTGASDMVARADAAMYEAKRAGKARRSVARDAAS